MSASESTARSTRIGKASVALALLSPVVLALGGFAAARYEALLVRSLIEPAFGMRVGAACAAATVLQLVLGAWVLRHHLRRPRRSLGRARFVALGSGATLHAAGAIGAATQVLMHMRKQDLLSGFGVSLSATETHVVTAFALLGAVGALVSLTASFASWPLIDVRVRARIWILVDAVLVVATTAVVAFLPSQPGPSAPRELALPILRHAITTAFALRLLVRLLPPAMDVIERIGFQTLVAARHLRAKKSGFLAAISLLSILAVTVSSCALTTTLSVMGGFRNDLKRKILGNNAHIAIDRDHATVEGWAPLLKATTDTPDVIGASPYVSGEVMLSSASNLATAVLRGIDTESVGRVSDLPKNLKTGSLDYLDHPEKLLTLPSGAATNIFSLPGILRKNEPAKAGTASQKADDLQKKLDELDEFLRKDNPLADGSKNRDVLPGIIVGQELARALRLYLGDEVNVVAPLGALGPSGPMPKARPFRVAGIFYSGMYEYDMKVTYVSLPTAQRFLNTGDAISGIEVKVRNVDNAPATAAALRTALQNSKLRVRDWQELNSRLFGALELEKLAMFIALGIAILVASFCIAGTLTLMVQEKGREVAILKAMGTSDATVVGVFVIEGGLIGLLGAALGMFLGYMMCFAAEHFGIRMNPEVYYIDRLPVHMDLTEFALTGLAAIAVCLLVTIYPALLASRLRPVDALRYE